MTEGTEPTGSPQPRDAEDLLTLLREHDTRERVFEAYPDAVLVLDVDGGVVDLNRSAAELLGRGRDEHVRFEDLLVDGGAISPTGGTWHGRLELRRPDGSTVSADARSVVVPGEREPLHVVVLSERPAGPLTDALDAAEEHQRRFREAEWAASEAARRADERIARLQAITDAALVHLTLDELFAELLGRLRELLGGDSVTVLLLDRNERVLRIRATSGLEREQEERLEVPLGVGVAGRIAAEARPIKVADLGRVRAVSPFLGRQLRSLVGVPILAHGGTVWGVLHVGSVRPRTFTDDDVAMLELVASRLAPAIENAELHEAERAARLEVEEEAERLRIVQSTAQALGTVRPVDEMARLILHEVLPRLGAVAGAIALLDDGGGMLDVVAGVGLGEDTLAAWRSFPLSADVPAAAAAREGRPVLIGSPAERDRLFPLLAGTQSVGRAWAALPLIVDERRSGVLAISFPDPRAFSSHDADLMAAIAPLCAQALDRARLFETEQRSRIRTDVTSRGLRLLQSLTASFSRALTSGEISEISVDEAAPALGAGAAAVLLRDDAGALRLRGSRGYDEPARRRWDVVPVERATPAGEAVRTREIVVAASPAEVAERFPDAPDGPDPALAGPTVAVPVVVNERPIGALVLTFREPRDVGPDDRFLLEALGRHCGQALERARLYETERRARREAERERERTDRLQALARALDEAESTGEVLEILAETLVAAVAGVAALAGGMTRDGGIEVSAVRGYPTREAAAWASGATPSEDTPLAEASRTRAGVWLGSGAELAERFPALADVQTRLGFRGALGAVPLMVGTRILGAAAVQLAEARRWDEDEKEFVRAIARQCAQALAQAELRRAEAEAARELERSERRYRSLVQATSAIDWTVDPVGAFVEPQPSWEAYTGQPWERHRGFGWLDAIDESDRELVLQRWLAARDSGEVFEATGRMWHAPSGEFRHFVSRAAPVRDAEGRIVEWVGTVIDVHDRRVAELRTIEREVAARQELQAAGDRLAYLAAASTVLAQSLDVDVTLQRLAELTVPRLADLCMVDVVEGDGGLRLVGVAHADPARAQQVRTLRRRRPVEPDAAEGVASVVRTGRPVLLERLSHGSAEVGGLDPDLAALVEDFGVRSIMIVPIARGDRIFGAMRFAWAGSPFAYDREDLALAEDLGHRAAIALENASLFEAERAARALETRSRERLQTLAEAGAAMAETLDGRRMLAALVRTTSRRLADIAAAYRVDRFGTPVDVVTAHRDPALDPVLQRAATIRFPDPEDRHHLVSQVLRTGAPVFEPAISESTLNEVRVTEEQRALGRRLRPTSGIAVPLSARGRLLGVLALVRGEASPPFVPEDLDLAVELARRAGSLLDNARLYAERHAIADTLQRSLLPPDLPEVPGLEIGARYRPADPGTTVGGDFYDVFEMDVEHWGVVIGDVVGKGAQAAAMMGLARYTVRTAALTESRPSSLLSTLNDAILRQMPESMFCTACVARVRREGPSVRVTVCTGGHPLPFVVRGDGSVLRVGEPGTLLGVFEDPALHDVVFDLDPGDALVLYTDGVTDERRDGDEEFGERRLQSLLASHAGRSAEEIAAAVDDAVASFRTGAARDDVAVLVVRVER